MMRRLWCLIGVVLVGWMIVPVYAGETPRYLKLQKQCFLKHPDLCQAWYDCQKGLGTRCFVVASALVGGLQGVKQDRQKGYTLMQRGCQYQHGPACAGLGLLHAQGWGTHKDLQQARTFYHRACQLKHGISCGTLGLYFMRGIGGGQDWVQARYAFRQACELGQGVGCYNTALIYALGKQVKPSPTKALAFYEKGCQYQYAKSCYNLGAYYYAQQKQPGALAKFVAYMKQACQAHWPLACRQLGLYYAHPTQRSSRQARTFFTHACKLKDGVGCFQLAQLVLQTPDITRYAVAAQAYQQACQQGHGISCNSLGVLYREGHLSPRPPVQNKTPHPTTPTTPTVPQMSAQATQAQHAFRRACLLRDGQGCYNLGVMLLSQQPPPYLLVRQWFQRACQEQVGVGCYNLGVLWLKGLGGPTSSTQARSYFQQACKIGFTPGCQTP